MRASLEPLPPDSFLLRVHPEPQMGLGDPYTHCCVIISRDGGRVAEIQGVHHPPSLAEARAAIKALKEQGFQFKRFLRRKHDREYWVEVPL